MVVYPAINSIEFPVLAEIPQKYQVITNNSINWPRTLDESPEIHSAEKRLTSPRAHSAVILLFHIYPAGDSFLTNDEFRTSFEKSQKYTQNDIYP